MNIQERPGEGEDSLSRPFFMFSEGGERKKQPHKAIAFVRKNDQTEQK